MTVHVCNTRRRAQAGGHTARWSTLTATTLTELHTAAHKLGLPTDWFTPHCGNPGCPTMHAVCPHAHYRITDGRRLIALHNRAQPATNTQRHAA